MIRLKTTKRIAKGLMGLFAFSFVMMNVTPAYAAEDKLADLNATIEGAAEQDSEAGNAFGELQSFFLSGSEDDSYTDIIIANPELEDIMPLLDPNEMVTDKWTVNPGTRYVTARFYLKKGQHVVMNSTVAPSTVTYWMGLMRDSNGDADCVESTVGAYYTFTAWADGYYRGFIQNRGNQDLNSHLTYYYY